MDRSEFVDTFQYYLSNQSLKYWRENKNDFEDDNSQVCEAFEKGAVWSQQYIFDKFKEFVNNHFQECQHHSDYNGGFYCFYLSDTDHETIDELVENFKEYINL